MEKICKYYFYILIQFLLISHTYSQKIQKEEIHISQKKLLKSFAAPCSRGNTITKINYNNVSTYVYMNGSLWQGIYNNAGYEIPKGSGKTSLYAGGIWIAGTDVNEQIKLAAARHPSNTNFWPGPLIASGFNRGTTDSESCYDYDKQWKISRSQVRNFRDWYNASNEEKSLYWKGYTIPSIIMNWPAHGNVAAGHTWNMAPWFDNNEDEIYNPGDGDYPFYDLDGILPCGTSKELRLPRLFGDATVWWIYNDNGNIHQSPNGDAIGIEIRAQAFQYSTNDAINDMSFYNFQLINRSSYSLLNTYFGIFASGSLGYMYDDYVGCHVTKGLGYFYNGVEVDGEGQTWAYGANPPAIGVDFFEGPYQDQDGLDNPSSFDQNGNLICDNNIMNGNINGLNFGDGIMDNERWGMIRFVSFGGAGVTGYPGSPMDYYNYLRGFWKDDEKIRYGGAGHPDDKETTDIETDFMFPGDSDPCGWGQGGQYMPLWNEESANRTPSSRRFVQSSGPFTLQPGAVNDITIGLVWAQSDNGGLQASVNKMLKADDVAQKLFENCFRIIDGPDAPELSIVEMDQKLIFHIWNKPGSNNYLESYNEEDPSINCPNMDPECDLYYKFQGYMVYQLKDPYSSISSISDQNTQQARLVFQCDIQDEIVQLVNYYWDDELEGNKMVQEVYGNNLGIYHSFELTTDAFAPKDHSLTNHKKYYYLIIAYASNDFLHYNQNDPNTINGQKKPFLAGRKGAGGIIKTYEAIPHIIDPEKGGTIIQGDFGDSPAITQLEGHGGGRNELDLSQETINEIMSGPPWRAKKRIYKPGYGPIDVKIIEPINVPDDNFIIKIDTADYYYNSTIEGNYKLTGKLWDGNWYIVRESTNDTIWSETSITTNNDQLILDWGLGVNITQVDIPLKINTFNLGYLNSSIEFEDEALKWLKFIKDNDGRYQPFSKNWIRSGYTSGDYGDRDEIFENVIDGTWAPYKYVSRDVIYGPGHPRSVNALDTKWQRLASVNLVITSDRDKWTRSPVIEMCPAQYLSIGNAKKFYLRTSPSINKYGVPEYPNDPDSIGMGWFPGYAIDVETGDRLNIIYGESSWLAGDNGDDLMWNPSHREGSALYQESHGDHVNGQLFFGGKHYIYIMGHNRVKSGTRDKTFMPAYDEGKLIRNKLGEIHSRFALENIFVNAMWVGIPMLDEKFYEEIDPGDDPYGFIKTDVTIKFRVISQYCADVFDWETPDSLSLNHNKPMWTFNTSELYTIRNDSETGRKALELIRIVPNPYYGYSKYERTQIDNIVKITNLPERCQISIYALNGILVRRFGKDNPNTFLQWNLKNNYGFPIAGGIYIIHINAYELGEKVIKFMGVLRPIDLNSF